MVTYTYTARIFTYEIRNPEGRVIQYGSRDTLSEIHTEVSFWLMRNNRTMVLTSEFVSAQCTDRDWRPLTHAESKSLDKGTLKREVRETDKGPITRR